MTCGDNINSVHKMKYIQEDERIIVVFCERCKARYFIRKYDGRTDPIYGKLLRRDTLQPAHNLYYKEYGKMNIV